MHENKMRFVKRSREYEFEDCDTHFPAEVITEWLFGSLPPPALSSSSLKGPGQRRKWQAVAGSDDCFVEKSAAVKLTAKKILISHSLWNSRQLKFAEVIWARALIENYEVYLWKGTDTDLLTATPLMSSHELWEQCNKIKPTSAAEIKAFFADHYIAASDWLILDKKTYSDGWSIGEFKKLEPYMFSSGPDLQKLIDSGKSQTTTDLYISIDHKESSTAMQISTLSKNFPQLKHLCILAINFNLNLPGFPYLETLLVVDLVSLGKSPKLIGLVAEEVIDSPEINAITANLKVCQVKKFTDPKNKKKGDEKAVEAVEKNGFSFFSFDPKMPANFCSTPKGNSKPMTYDGLGELKSLLAHNDKDDLTPLLPSTHRILIYDSIELKNGLLHFIQSPLSSAKRLPAKPILALNCRKIPGDLKIDSGFLEGPLQYGMEYPLPLSAPVKKDGFFQIYGDVKPGTTVEYFPTAQQGYGIRLLAAPGSKSKTQVSLYYDFEPQPHYSTYSTYYLKEQACLLPRTLAKELKKALSPEKKLAFLFDSRISLTRKIQALEKYCREFDRAKKLDNHAAAEGSLQQMIDIIIEQRGNCEQSACTFMLLAMLIGAQVRMIRSEKHRWCEIQDQDDNYLKIDLGGAGSMDGTGVNRSAEDFLKTFKPLIVRNPPSEQKYTQFIHDHLKKPIPFNWELFGTSTKPILIELPPDLETGAVRGLYFPRADISGKFLYIDSPADLAINRYWSPFAIIDGHRKKICGPLQEIFNEGGTLLINWSNFSSEEQEHYEKLLTQQQLDDHRAKQPVNIVGFIKPGLPCTTSFDRHCRRCYLPAAVKPIEIKASKAELIVIDLYAGADWEEQLLGTYKFKHNDYTLTTGPLLQAIAEKRPLVIHRPPADILFQTLLDQIKAEGRFFFNGRWIEVPPEVNITIKTEALNQKSKTAHCKRLDTPPETKDCILLHLNNWHTLYEQEIFDPKNHTGASAPGLLEHYAGSSSPPVFYVTETIPQPEWERLEKFIHTHWPKKTFFFYSVKEAKEPQPLIAPESSEKIMPALKKHIADNRRSLHYSASDPHFLSQLLQKLCPKEEQARIIDIGNLAASDLLGSITQQTEQEEKDGSAPLYFYVEKHALLTALATGKTVILHGRLPSRLRQELLSVFATPPYLHFNGEKIPVSGRLILVEPEQTDAKLSSLHPVYSVNFTPAEYRAALLTQKKSSDLIDKLLLFFKAADYPHRGQAMPASLGMNWERLVQMIKMLESGVAWHAHNPAKGLLGLKYNKDSEYYAFLNVLSKFLFDTNPKDPIRLKKYQQLPATADYGWRLLNTCNGATLREILGKDWIGEGQNLFSRWKQADLQNIITKLNAVKPDTSKSTAAAPRLSKMQKRLKTLIENKSTPKVIVIQGEAGVGKTHYLQQLSLNPAYCCVNGLENIGQWLTESKDGKPKLLLIDEANTHTPGTLDFLAGLNRDPQEIFYNNSWHRLTPLHKVVVAINPAHYPGRFRHDILENGVTVPAYLPEAAYLCEWMAKTYALPVELAKQVLQAADLFTSYQPLTRYSFRALQNIMLRYTALSAQAGSQTKQQILFEAVHGQFGIAINDAGKRRSFTQKLQAIFPGAASTRPHGLLPELTDAQEAVRQALLVRQHVQKTGIKLNYQRGVVLQGGAGIGKFRLCKSLLQKAGLTPAPADLKMANSKKHYFIAVPGEHNFEAIAEHAYRTGGVLLIQKMHQLTSAHERFLGGLLTQAYPSVKVPQPGFLVLGLRYLSSDISGGALSAALCDRMQMVSIPRYSDDSWTKLAQTCLADSKDARSFVESFWHPTEPYPHQINGHDFFDILRQINPPTPVTTAKPQTGLFKSSAQQPETLGKALFYIGISR